MPVHYIVITLDPINDDILKNHVIIVLVSDFTNSESLSESLTHLILGHLMARVSPDLSQVKPSSLEDGAQVSHTIGLLLAKAGGPPLVIDESQPELEIRGGLREAGLQGLSNVL